jgi:hypothetical protein
VGIGGQHQRCDSRCDFWYHHRVLGLAHDIQNKYILQVHSDLGSVVLAIETILIFFFCPETAYRRANDLNLDLGVVYEPKALGESDHGSDESPWTFREQLRPWRGVESDDDIFKLIIRPLPLLLFPQVFYAFVTGLSMAWFSVLAGASALIFGSPPYNFSVEQLGLLCIGGVVASLLGFCAGPLNDWLCKVMARRNNGIYEPEASPSSMSLT